MPHTNEWKNTYSEIYYPDSLRVSNNPVMTKQVPYKWSEIRTVKHTLNNSHDER